jgi:hypothetical protein
MEQIPCEAYSPSTIQQVLLILWNPKDYYMNTRTLHQSHLEPVNPVLTRLL